jgi:organic radical activating enzyme
MEKEDELSSNEKLSIPTNELYRLPWTMSDNAMTWIEPTRSCNIRCDACFHFPDPTSHKSLAEICSELEKVMKLRKCDALLIAGGEPLTHPAIIDIVKMVISFRVKPILMTNGVGLNEKMTRELKKAGLKGITFHIDSHQNRPGWEGKNESELNQLREEFASMLKKVKGLTCAFNTTIFPDTLEQVPDIVSWAKKNIDKVNILSLIAVRMVHSDDPAEYWVGNRKISMQDTPYHSKVKYQNLKSEDIYRQILKVIPGYRFNSFLGGTSKSDSPKWLLSAHIGKNNLSFGNLGARTMEFLQIFHHLTTGKYLGFNSSNLNRMGKLTFIFCFIDKSVRRLFKSYFKYLIRNPFSLFKPLYLQSITVVQPVDILSNGETDNCDGCPNKTLWNGRLVSACRLEEYMIYGAPIQIVPHDFLFQN